ncbi:MAG: hypothetical protein ACLQBA_07655 [Candidatus Binataceae bacterium]
MRAGGRGWLAWRSLGFIIGGLLVGLAVMTKLKSDSSPPQNRPAAPGAG